jgi:hypothetical protein
MDTDESARVRCGFVPEETPMEESQRYRHLYQQVHEFLVTQIAQERARFGFFGLKLEPGAPLLPIDRVALSLEGVRVERPVNRHDTAQFVYAVTLS